MIDSIFNGKEVNENSVSNSDTNNFDKSLMHEMIAELALLKNQVDTCEQKIKKLKEKNETLKNYNDSFKKNIKDLYLMFHNQNDKLDSSLALQERYKNESVQLKTRSKNLEKNLENLKNQLSYKVGQVLVNATKHKREIKKLPYDLFNAYREFYKEKLRKEILKDVVGVEQISLKPSKLAKFNEGHIAHLRANEYGVFLDTNQLKSMKVFSVKALSIVPETKSSITCNVKVISGDLGIKTEYNQEKFFLTTDNNSKKIIFDIDDGETLPIFSITSINNAVVEVTFAKRSGQPMVLTLCPEINHIENKKPALDDKSIRYDYLLPEKPRVHLLWNAMNIAKDFGYVQAIHYAEKYKKELNKNAINILKANYHAGDDDKWLVYVNNYLKSLGVTPLSLDKDTSKDRFERIFSNVDYEVEDDLEKVSVIMPAYNAEKTILKSVTSILSQTWKNLELIVINDCSNDGTMNILNSIFDNRLKVINNKVNVGAYVSKNIALKYATGDYITGHDADDWAHPQRIENHMKELKKIDVAPKASLTYMIRVDKNGFFSHIGKEGTFSVDGVLRIASITCMFDANFLKNVLGGWDSVRFGADSEIIARAKLILGDEFKQFPTLSMICLDAEGSLTNDPIHGVSKVTGISPTRKAYKDSWMEWHKTLKNDFILEFPHVDRKFEAPQAAMVNLDLIFQNLN